MRELAIKQQAKELLEQNMGRFISGEEIALALGCSRGAVWKAVKQLQNEGYPISAVTNKGYCLDEKTDRLSKNTIEKLLGESAEGLDIRVFDTIDSTNNYLKELASKGESEGAIAISEQQTGGKGRLGRKFYSPAGSGLYISFLLRPSLAAAEAAKITTMAAVAVAEAIEESFSVKTDIKWVNDVYINGRKICGILTEAAFDLESGGLDYAVCGIGINVYEPVGGFPDEIKDIAGAVLDETTGDARNRLSASLISRFFCLYNSGDPASYYEDYTKRLIWKGEQINVIKPKLTRTATMLGVDKDCKLHVRYEDGTEEYIASGEISIRRK